MLLCSAAFGADAGKQATAGFRPAFEVRPLVHRFEAPPGKTIDFAFDAKAFGGATRLKVEVVPMKQRETGEVEPDEDGEHDASIRLISPAEMELKADKPTQVRGRLTVPSAGSFHAFGLLVTDLGPADQRDRKEPQGVGVGVKFVTRYLLRVEVGVRGVRDDTARKLELAGGGVGDTAGRAVANVMVHNPTATQFEFEAECRIYKKGSEPVTVDGGKPLFRAIGPAFKLAMPCRSNPADAQRFRSRVLGSSRVRVQAPVPEPLMPGDYEMETTLLVNSRPAATQRFPLTITADQFPGQAAVVAPIVAGVQVSPTQVELSMRAKGNRLVPLKVTNTSDRAVSIQVEPRAATGEQRAPSWAVIRPDSFTLAPGATRNVVVSLAAADKFTEHQYARLNVEVTPQDGGVGGGRNLNLALVTRAQTPPRLTVGKLNWNTQHPTPSFDIPVTNEGRIHVPLSAKLSLTDSFGRAIELEGGFQKWLLPGESGSITFPTPRPIPPGDYIVKAEVQTGSEPVRMKERVKIEAAAVTSATR